MKSKVFLLLAFVAVAQFASAQMSFRMGLDAGANMSFYKAEFAGLLKDYIVDDVKPAVSPSVGLNLALDFGIDKKKSFGFYVDWQFTSTHWSVSFGESGSDNTLYKISHPTMNVIQGVYFAFDIKKMKRKKRLQAMFGVGAYEDIRLKGKITEEETGAGYSTVPGVAAASSGSLFPGLDDSYMMEVEMPLTYDIGINAMAGIMYRFNQHFFIQGRLIYMLPLMGSASTIDDAFDTPGTAGMGGMSGMTTPTNFNKNSLNPYVAYKNDKINRLALVATIGFSF